MGKKKIKDKIVAIDIKIKILLFLKRLSIKKDYLLNINLDGALLR